MKGISENLEGLPFRIRLGLKKDICLKTAMLAGKRFSSSSTTRRRKPQALFRVSSTFLASSTLSPADTQIMPVMSYTFHNEIHKYRYWYIFF